MNSPATPPEGVSTSDVPSRPGPVQRLYDKVAGEVALKHPWYTLPKDLGLAELIGIRERSGGRTSSIPPAFRRLILFSRRRMTSRT
jgi:hypothetical protein